METKKFVKEERKVDKLPLYDTLIKKIKKDAKFTKKDEESLLTNVKKCNDEGKNLVYVLIRYHFLKTGGKEKELPYSSTYSSKKFVIKLEKMPMFLKKILLSFTNLHIKKMKEEEKLTNEREKNLSELLEEN